MNSPIQGIHHITAIASDPQRNLDFYTRVLGLHLVKKTVNFDDPGTYHFYFGDAHGQPGTILTFFPWPKARRGRKGSGQVTLCAFAVPPASLGYWADRLKTYPVTVGAPFRRFDEDVLPVLDPDGLALELIETEDSASITPAEGSVDPAHAIRGFAAPTLLVNDRQASAALLTETFGLRLVREDFHRQRFAAPPAAGFLPGAWVDVENRPDASSGHMGAGVIHHIAFRAPDDPAQLAWREKLIGLGFEVTPVLDRQYFHSIYFREPNGILFEIATDPPGFTFDEPIEALGADLKLPSWLEARRELIERTLPSLTHTR